MELKGKTVLVTGAAKRIGREIARGFAAKGSNVLVHYLTSEAEAEGLSRELRQMKVESRAYRADLADVGEVKSLAQKVLGDFGAVDLLVNNASIFFKTPLGKVTEEEWDRFLSINLKAPFFLAQALAPSMKERGAGRIINIADWSGLKPYRDYLPYCVSKGGLITLTEALAKSLAPEVLVTAVCPGPILPPADFQESEKRDTAKKTLVGRWGGVDEVVRMVLFLAESDFATGSTHLIDGGEILK